MKRRKTASYQCDGCSSYFNYRSYDHHVQECPKRSNFSSDNNDNESLEMKKMKSSFESDNDDIILGDVNDNINGASSQSERESSDDDENVATDIFINSKNELHKYLNIYIKINGFEDIIKLKKFYENGTALASHSSASSISKVEQVNVGEEFAIQMFRGIKLNDNNVKKLHRKIKKITKDDDTNKVVSDTIRVEMITHGKQSIYAETRIIFRPFINFLQVFVNDEKFQLSYIDHKPLALKDNVVCSSYSSSEEYHRVYSHFKDLNKENMLLFPIAIWTDGVCLSWQGSESVYPVIISSPITAGYNMPMKVIGFFESNTIYSSNDSSNNPTLRQMLSKLTFEKIFDELDKVQRDGGININFGGKKVWFIPYICFQCCDSIEGKKHMGCTGCPYCFKKMISKYNQYDFEGSSSCFKMGERNIGQYDDAQTNSIKNIETYRDTFQHKEIYGSFPCLPDGLHSLLLGLSRKLCLIFYESLSEKQKNWYANKMFGHINIKKIGSMLGSEVSKLVTVNIVVLARSDVSDLADDVKCEFVLLFFYFMQIDFIHLAKKSINVWRVVFNCISLLIINYCKESLSTTDLTTIDDAVETLKGNLPHIPEFKASDSMHYALDHLFQRSVLKMFGSPKHFGCARYERSLQQLKDTFKSSNHKNPIELEYLQRQTYLDCISPVLNYSSNGNEFALPSYHKMIMAESFEGGKCLKFSIGFVDTNRKFLLIENLLIKIQSANRNRVSCRSSIVELGNAYGLVQYAEITQHTQVITEKVSFLNTNLLNLKCKIIIKQLKDDKGNITDPHPDLWRRMQVSAGLESVDVDDVTGICSSIDDANGKIWVSSPQVAQIFINGKTIVSPPDERFNSCNY